ncbi:MAG: MFS transporter [Burkholderiales bacterium]|nr:MFS transporter [Burkholderiales bacterium]MBP9768714.1 MFS transporter [Burkholderiales bacterium]
MSNQFRLNAQERKIVGLAALGGMLEFYDFIIYGMFSVYFAHQFFPSNNQLLSIIESYVVFVLGYLSRPIGGMLFSHIGDEHGRKKVLVITIILMGISSLGIGLLPTYQQIGVIAPIGLVVFRLLQGLALGGELPSTYVYISESMPNKRGSGFGITMVGVNSGLLLGSLINQLLNFAFTPAELTSYGWRIPFILGGVICLISYKIRQTLHETAAFQRIEDKPEFPLGFLFKHHLPQMIAGIATTAIMSGLVVVAIIFMPTYLHNILKVENRTISLIMTFAMLSNVLMIYILGKVANTTSPYIILRNLLIACVILIPFSYWLISLQFYAAGTIILATLEGAAAMIIPYLVTCLFPAKIRLTGVAMCYNIGFTIFGGMAPIIISSGIKADYGIYATPLIYMFVIIIVCAIGLGYAKRHSHQAI